LSDLRLTRIERYQKVSLSDCLGVKHAVDPPHASAAVSSKSWLRGNFDAIPTEQDEDVYKPNRLESKPPGVSEVSAHAYQDHTVFEEIRNMTKFLQQGFTLTEDAARNSTVTRWSTTDLYDVSKNLL